jgi:iron complex outermembrane receptor protein
MLQHPKLTAIALAVASLSQPVFSADTEAPEVIVSASRFAEASTLAPANITVISREEIRSTPAMNLPDLLRSQTGLNVRSLYGQMATNSTVDLRGFGDAAASNTLILLDGQRLNPIDSGGINWASIPLEGVRRIEIIRGSGTVLYGDRASGGVINIITDKSAKPESSVAATLGSHGYQGLDAHLAGSQDATYYNLTGHYADAAGWRQNSQSDQLALSGRLARRLDQGEGFLDFATSKDSSGTPAALFRNQYLTQPTLARYPYDNQSHEGYRLRPGFSYPLSPTLTFDGEVAYSQDRYLGRNFTAAGASSYRSDRVSETWSVTPRLRWQHGLGSMRSETVLGLDYYDAKLNSATWSSFSGNNAQGASQVSEAFYVQNTTNLTDSLALSLGGRTQRMRQQAMDAGAGMNDGATRSRNAWEIGLAQQATETTRVYAKLGRTFRFPNTDELFAFNPLPPWQTIFAGDLKPQQGMSREIGSSWQGVTSSFRASLFRTDLTDEIAYDGTTFTNVNLPATRHEGLELEGQWQAAKNWLLRGTYTYTDAAFTEGNNQGRDIPMVPKNRGSMELRWQGGQAGTWGIVANYTGSQRGSGDAANTRDKLGAYATLDLRADWDLKPWKLSARVTNLLDRRYASYGGYSTTWADYYYYPADPRSLFVTVGYAFR